MLKHETIKLELNAAGAAAGTSDVDGAVIDMAGYEGCLIFASLAVAASGNYLQLLHGDTSSPTDTVLGSKVLTDSTNDVAILEVHRPLKRYLKPQLKRGTSTASGDLYVVKYGPRTKPQTNDVANSTNLVALTGTSTGTP